jgi:hypothetical protein
MSAASLFGGDGKILSQYIPDAPNHPIVYYVDASGSFTKEENTVIDGCSLTAPYTGRYMFSAQINYADVSNATVGVSTSVIYADISGGGFNPIFTNEILMRDDSLYVITIGGILQTDVPAGTIVNILHSEDDAQLFTFSGALIKITWSYLGDINA